MKNDSLKYLCYVFVVLLVCFDHVCAYDMPETTGNFDVAESSFFSAKTGFINVAAGMDSYYSTQGMTLSEGTEDAGFMPVAERDLSAVSDKNISWREPLELKSPVLLPSGQEDLYGPLPNTFAGNSFIRTSGGITPKDPDFIDWQKNVYQDVDLKQTDKLAFIGDLTQSIYDHAIYNPEKLQKIRDIQATIIEGQNAGLWKNRIFDAREMQQIIDAGAFKIKDYDFSANKVLLSGKGTCTQFAVTESYLLGQNGIRSEIIATTFHAFLKVRIDGRDYIADPTLNKVLPYEEYMNDLRTTPGMANIDRKDGVSNFDPEDAIGNLGSIYQDRV